MFDRLKSAIDDARRFSIDDFAEYIHDNLMKKIIEVEREKNLNCRNGMILFELLDEKSFRVSYKIYFEESSGEQFKAMEFYEDYKISLLKQTAIAELKLKGKIEFDITPPTAEERDKILRDMKK